MMSVNLRALIGKLNAASRSAVEGAAGLCLSRSHYDIEIEHFLVKALDATDGDLAQILKHYGVNRSRLADDLARGMDRLKSGNARTPSLSPTLVKVLTEAWSIGSLEFGAHQVRTGHCLLALLTNEELARLAKDISREFEKIAPEVLHKEFVAITAPSVEAAAEVGMAPGGRPAESGGAPKGGGKTANLDQFTVDLTARARAGLIDPVLGRDFEVRQVVDILTRRRQNNPILTGEAGVGKTAVVEGFALRVAEGDVPEPLKNVAVRTLDLGLLQAGAGIKGEFENRLKSVIDEVKSSPQPIILFIDEAHTMIGAGGAAGQNDAANLLKPALARGELRTIAATTWAEYKKYFEKDAALARRFQVVKVEEPDKEKAIDMMRGLVDKMEEHHNVRILDEAIVDCVKLSHRYITGRQLPDKSVSVLDTACAKVAIGQGATPGAVEDATRRIQNLSSEINSLEREQVTGAAHDERLEDLQAKRAETQERLARLNEQWEKEKDLTTQIRNIRLKLEMSRLDSKSAANGDSADVSAVSTEGAEAPETAAAATAESTATT